MSLRKQLHSTNEKIESTTPYSSRSSPSPPINVLPPQSQAQIREQRQPRMEHIQYAHTNMLRIVAIAMVLIGLFYVQANASNSSKKDWKLKPYRSTTPIVPDIITSITLTQDSLNQIATDENWTNESINEFWQALIRYETKRYVTGEAIERGPYIYRLISVMSIVYGFGTIIVIISAILIIHSFWNNGYLVAFCAAIYSFLFHSAARLLITSTSSSFLGNCLYIGPIVLSSIIVLGLLKGLGLWAFRPLDFQDAEFFSADRKTWRNISDWKQKLILVPFMIFKFCCAANYIAPPEWLVSSVIVQVPILVTTLLLYEDTHFPLLQLITLVSSLFLLVTIIEILLPTNINGSIRTPRWVLALSIVMILCLRYAITSSEWAFGASIVGSILALFGIWYFVMHNFIVVLTPGMTLENYYTLWMSKSSRSNEFGLTIYFVLHVAFLIMALRYHRWAFIPTGLLGISATLFISTSRRGDWIKWLYQTAIGLVLLTFTIAMEDLIDPCHQQLVSWFNSDSRDDLRLLHWINSALRFSCVSLAVCSMIYSNYKLLDKVLRTGSRRGRVPLENSVMYVVLSSILIGIVETFAVSEMSEFLGTLINVLASQYFLTSLLPVYMLVDDKWITPAMGSAIALPFNLRMILLAQSNHDLVGFIGGLISIFAWFLVEIFYNSNCKLNSLLLQAAVLPKCAIYLVFAVVANSPILAVFAIGSIYIMCLGALFQITRNLVERALFVTVLGAITLHLGVIFQHNFHDLELIVIKYSPHMLRSLFVPSTQATDIESQISFDLQEHIYVPALRHLIALLQGEEKT